jgi:Domain of unknown function (DUF4158)
MAKLIGTIFGPGAAPILPFFKVAAVVALVAASNSAQRGGGNGCVMRGNCAVVAAVVGGGETSCVTSQNSDGVGLAEIWTLEPADLAAVRGKRGATALGFAVLLRYFRWKGRFPRASDVPGDAVAFVAGQLGLKPVVFRGYDWNGRMVKYHRDQIRSVLGFRQVTLADEDHLTEWLTENVAVRERRVDRVTAAAVARFADERIELPTSGRLQRIVRSSLHNAEQRWAETIWERLSPETRNNLAALIDSVNDDDVRGQDSLLGLVKSAPGNVSLDSMLVEINKLRQLRSFALPSGLFADVAPKVLADWRSRAMIEAPSHLRRHSKPVSVMLLAGLVFCREREVTDALVELFVAAVHRIGARAKKRVIEELVNEIRRVTGKETILFAITNAALERPDDKVRDVIFPTVKGGEQTFRDLAAEQQSSGPVYRRTVQTKLRLSYTNHYRRGLIALLETLEFRSNNDTHRPVVDALTLVGKYARASNMKYFPLDETIPEHKATLSPEWVGVVHETDGRGHERIVRSVYEIVTFQSLREQLRCKEIWVVGADTWRNPTRTYRKTLKRTEPRTIGRLASQSNQTFSLMSFARRWSVCLLI